MKERSPAFQFYPRQFSGDDQIMAMDLEAIGAHILLMCAAAASPERYRIDADEYAIRMRLRNPADADWERIRKQLLSGPWKLSADGKWWVQDGFSAHSRNKRTSASRSARRLRPDGMKRIPKQCPVHAKPMPNSCRKPCRRVYQKYALHLHLHLQTLRPATLALTPPR